MSEERNMAAVEPDEVSGRIAALQERKAALEEAIRLEVEVQRLQMKLGMVRSTARAVYVGAVSAVARHTGVTAAEMQSRKRTARVAEARFAVWWLMRKLSVMTLEGIAKFFERDHTAIVNGVQRMDFLFETDKGWRELLTEMQGEVGGKAETTGLRTTGT